MADPPSSSPSDRSPDSDANYRSQAILAKRAQQESESLYDSLVETLPVSVLRKDLDGRITFVNNTFCATSQKSAEELLGKTDHDLYPEELATRYRKDDQRVLKGGKPLDNIEEHQLPDGKVISVRVLKRPVFNFLGTMIGTEAVFWDVTEEEQAKRAVVDSEVRKRAILESALDCIIFTDDSGRIVELNRAAERTFDCKFDEVEGQELAELFVPLASRARYRDNLSRYTSDGEVGSLISRRLELLMMRRDGEQFHAEMAVQPIPLKGAVGFAIFLHDITDRKRAQHKLERYADELKRSNQELAEFAYVASHDLHAPLRRVKSFSALLQSRCEGKLSAESEEFLGNIVECVEGMQQLIDRLLTYSRVDSQPLVLEETDCSKVLRQTLANLEIEIGQCDAQVTFESLPTIAADPIQLGQLFQNLIANAIKFRVERTPQIQIAASRSDEHWLFTVRDNGIGIDAEHTKLIFDVFRRLHGEGRYSGSGIGLATCKKIVQRHGGRIWVESESGKGSVFCFTIPADRDTTGGSTRTV